MDCQKKAPREREAVSLTAWGPWRGPGEEPLSFNFIDIRLAINILQKMQIYFLNYIPTSCDVQSDGIDNDEGLRSRGKWTILRVFQGFGTIILRRSSIQNGCALNALKKCIFHNF